MENSDVGTIPLLVEPGVPNTVRARPADEHQFSVVVQVATRQPERRFIIEVPRETFDALHDSLALPPNVRLVAATPETDGATVTETPDPIELPSPEMRAETPERPTLALRCRRWLREHLLIDDDRTRAIERERALDRDIHHLAVLVGRLDRRLSQQEAIIHEAARLLNVQAQLLATERKRLRYYETHSEALAYAKRKMEREGLYNNAPPPESPTIEVVK